MGVFKITGDIFYDLSLKHHQDITAVFFSHAEFGGVNPLLGPTAMAVFLKIGLLLRMHEF